jgi:hypothetical protein
MISLPASEWKDIGFDLLKVETAAIGNSAQFGVD